jgi:hypothetical protein
MIGFRIIWFFLMVGLAPVALFAKKVNEPANAPIYNSAVLPASLQRTADAIFDSASLNSIGLERDVFYKAYKGFSYLLYKGLVNNPTILTIADFSQSSRNKRLYVIDLVQKKVVYNTFVSHGKNSGHEMATSFSNLRDSYKSAIGFMLTDDTYNGHCGYSLRFNGMEPGINDQIRSRAIILHGSHYVNGEKADEEGRVGNSLGCPAVPLAECRPIIDYIKGGTVYFIYSPNEDYSATSPVLNGTLIAPPMLVDVANLPVNVLGPLVIASKPATQP